MQRMNDSLQTELPAVHETLRTVIFSQMKCIPIRKDGKQ